MLIAPSPSVNVDQAVRRRPRTRTAPTPIATTPMIAISSMSAPVNASPLDEVVLAAVFAPSVTAGLLAGVAGVAGGVTPVVGVVQPV
jgi:hypothetical protein